MKSKDEIFEGKTFQDLTHDIYKNTSDRKKQIDLLISEIHGFITTIDDVVMVAPIIKEYMEVSVKNDEHLVKLAGVIQRIIAKSSGGDEESKTKFCKNNNLKIILLSVLLFVLLSSLVYAVF